MFWKREASLLKSAESRVNAEYETVESSLNLVPIKYDTDAVKFQVTIENDAIRKLNDRELLPNYLWYIYYLVKNGTKNVLSYSICLWFKGTACNVDYRQRPMIYCILDGKILDSCLLYLKSILRWKFVERHK